MADLSSLIARVEAATGPDRELDARLDALARNRTGFRWGGHYYDCDQLVGAGGDDVFPYTSSVDYALALVERLLPGWAVSLTWQPSLNPPIAYCRIGMAVMPTKGRTLPLAILSALLKALEAQPTHMEVEGE